MSAFSSTHKHNISIIIYIILNLQYIFAIQYKPEYYLVTTKTLSWTDSQAYCQSECNSNLVSIHSVDDNTELISFVNDSTKDIWIGLYDEDEYSSQYDFKWIDGTQFDYGNVSQSIHPWFNGQPPINQTSRNCIQLDRNNGYSWKTGKCQTKKYFVCNSCYKQYHYLLSHEFTWDTANTFCTTRCGSNLSNIDGYSNNYYTTKQAMDNNLVNKNIWLGLKVININNSQWIGHPDNMYGITDTSPFETVPSSSGCVYMQRSNNYIWNSDTCSYKYNFFCDECDGKINKYMIIKQLGIHYIPAHDLCDSVYGTALASIHSVSDMEEAVNLCTLTINDGGCWIGLNDKSQEGIFVWDDGTDFDFGTNVSGYGGYPWSDGRPYDQSMPDLDCVHIDSNNDKWTDWLCDTSVDATICNKPSVFCEGNMEVISGNGWDINDCNDIKYTVSTDEGIMILDGIQWMNGNSNLLMEYMLKISAGNGHSGILLFNFDDICNYYYIGIAVAPSMVFVVKVFNGYRSTLIYNDIITMGYVDHYTLKINVVNSNILKVYVDNVEYISYIDTDRNGTDDAMSGFIGVFNKNAVLSAKYLYVSGVPVDIESHQSLTALYAQCPIDLQTYAPTMPTSNPIPVPSAAPTEPSLSPTKFPTKHPTTDPTKDPTFDPTIDPTKDPTTDPTMNPTKGPTKNPTETPTKYPTEVPSFDPTQDPTTDPTKTPTIDPTHGPTIEPTVTTKVPTTSEPTRTPTKIPTDHPPSIAPTKTPTKTPSKSPTKTPTKSPTKTPSKSPTKTSTKTPSKSPTKTPSKSPINDAEAPSSRHNTTINEVNDSTKTEDEGSFLSVIIAGMFIIGCCMIFLCVAIIWKMKQTKKMEEEEAKTYNSISSKVHRMDAIKIHNLSPGTISAVPSHSPSSLVEMNASHIATPSVNAQSADYTAKHIQNTSFMEGDMIIDGDSEDGMMDGYTPRGDVGDNNNNDPYITPKHDGDINNNNIERQRSDVPLNEEQQIEDDMMITPGCNSSEDDVSLGPIDNDEGNDNDNDKNVIINDETPGQN